MLTAYLKTYSILIFILLFSKLVFSQDAIQKPVSDDVPESASNIVIHGIIPEKFIAYMNGTFDIPLDEDITLELFGDNLLTIKKISFTHDEQTLAAVSSPCNVSTGSVSTDFHNGDYLKKFKYKFLHPGVHYICVKPNDSDSYFYPKAARQVKFSFNVKGPLLPLWLHISLIIILFIMSGIFSGLNIGLMTMGKTELKIIETAGSETEKRYAKTIRPVRERGNFLLCTLLIGNVLVNNSLTILMDDLTGNGIYAVIASTLGITIFGEIVPQAMCCRHGLAIGAKTIWLTKFFMLITFPLTFPISLILDYILGEELGAVYNRKKLAVLVKEQEEVGTVMRDELNIITGALAITTKTVEDVMTPLGDAFMVSQYDKLDFNMLNEIFRHGFTRIPVFGDERSDIRAILNVKDLAFVNADHQIPVSTICEFYNRSVIIVPNHTTLECMLKEFRQGKAHMAFVERLIKDDITDPYWKTIGLVTLEDVIEEIIQAEIVDETDIVTDNVNRSVRYLRKRDFRIFHSNGGTQLGGGIPISPQLKINALRHLVSDIVPFREHYINLAIMQSMLNSPEIILRIHSPTDENSIIPIYERNVSSNIFILILQGVAEVQFNSPELRFQVGPFHSFGEVVLTQNDCLYD